MDCTTGRSCHVLRVIYWFDSYGCVLELSPTTSCLVFYRLKLMLGRYINLKERCTYYRYKGAAERVSKGVGLYRILVWLMSSYHPRSPFPIVKITSRFLLGLMVLCFIADTTSCDVCTCYWMEVRRDRGATVLNLMG